MGISPKQMILPSFGTDPICPFSAVRAVGCVRDFRVLPYTVFTTSVHYGDAVITVRRLLYMVRRSFSELFPVAFTL